MPASDFVATPPYNVLQPGAYSVVDTSKLTTPDLTPGQPIPAIIATALGGQPNTPLYFSNAGLLQQVIRGGIAYDMARFVLDGGTPQVCVVRVGNSVTNATLALAGATGTVVTLTSKDWGTWNNSIRVTVAASNVITLTYTDSFGNTFTEGWDLSTVGGLTVAQVAQAINGQFYGYAGSNYVTAVAGAGTLPLTTVSNSPLAGGTDGLVPVAGDWTNGLTALEAELVDIVTPGTADATVHAQVQTHCQNMSLPAARHERVQVCGGLWGDSVAATVARQAALVSARTELVYPGFHDFNTAGVLTAYDSFYMAAKLAGMHCALPDPATSLIHHKVPIVNAEVNLSTIQGGAIDQLLKGGVTPIAKAPGGGFWVVDAITGYNLADGTFRSLIKVRSADFVAQYARAILEGQFVGGKSLSGTKNAIQAAANGAMTSLQTMQIIQAFQAAQVSAGANGGTWLVSLPVMLVDTNKFIFITVQLQPSSTATGSTTASDLS